MNSSLIGAQPTPLPSTWTNHVESVEPADDFCSAAMTAALENILK